MSKKFLPVVLFAALILNGCISSYHSDYFKLAAYEDDHTLNKVEMQTYDPESEFFTFIYDPKVWDIEEWPEEEAPNVVVLVNKKYEDRSCYLFPGSIGQGQEPGTKVYQGTLLTTKGRATTLDVYNMAGIRLKQIVGYEVDGFPYIFEVTLPASDQDECYQDAQLVNATFETPSMLAALEEAMAAEEAAEKEAEEAAEEEIVEEITEDEIVVETEKSTEETTVQ